MSDGPGKRPLRLDGGRSIETYLDAHPDDFGKICDALMSIQEGSWAGRYRHLDDVTNKFAVIMFIEPTLVIVWRIIVEYPEWFRVIYVGHPDGQ